MSRFKPYRPEQAYLLPPSVKDVLGTGHLCFFVQQVMGQLDLSPFEQHYSAEGGELYAVPLMLSVWLYAYATGLTSARELERRIREDLPLRYLAGAEAGAHGPYDVVLELVGGPGFEANLPALAPGGRIAVIGVGGGARVALDLLTLMGRRGRVMGSTLRSRSLEEKALTARRVEAELLPLVETGRLRVIVEGVFALESASDAYARFQTGGKLGKIVLISCALATGA